MTQRDKIRQRIASLLELAARPGTPAEGETARAMAHRLAEKHGFKITQRRGPTINPKAEADAREREARRAAAKALSELRRRMTRVENCRVAGYDAWFRGLDRACVPFKRGKTFGVDQRAEWLRGWEDAKADHPDAFGYDKSGG